MNPASPSAARPAWTERPAVSAQAERRPPAVPSPEPVTMAGGQQAGEPATHLTRAVDAASQRTGGPDTGSVTSTVTSNITSKVTGTVTSNITGRVASSAMRETARAVDLLPALPPPDPLDRYDVRAVTVQWLLQLAPASRRGYFGALADWLGWCARNDLDPLAARRVDVDGWRAQLTAQRRGWPGAAATAEPAANTVRKRLAALSSWYSYLQGSDLEVGNPARGVKRPKPPASSPFPALSAAELAGFLEWLLARAEAKQSEAAWRDAAMLHLMFHTGLRIAAVLDAQISDVRMESGHTVLHYAKKGGGRDWVPLTDDVQRVLHRYWAVRAANAGLTVDRLDGHMFVSTAHPRRKELTGGRPIRQANAHAHARRLARQAGLTSWARFTLHSARRTAGTIALASGATLAQVQDLLGHADPRTTRRYDDARHRLATSPVHTIAAALAAQHRPAPHPAQPAAGSDKDPGAAML